MHSIMPFLKNENLQICVEKVQKDITLKAHQELDIVERE